jgi:hypothetical protein
MSWSLLPMQGDRETMASISLSHSLGCLLWQQPAAMLRAALGQGPTGASGSQSAGLPNAT